MTRRQVLVGALLAVSGLLVAGGVVAFVVWKSWQPTNVWVLGLHDDSEGFSVEFEHRRISAEGSEYEFSTDASFAEIVETFDAIYPSGEVVGSETWQVVVDGSMFVLGPAPTVDGISTWTVEGQYLGVGTADQMNWFSVPFPVTLTGTKVATLDEPLVVDVSVEELAAFYDQLPDISRDGATFTVPTSASDKSATITVSDGAITVSAGGEV